MAVSFFRSRESRIYLLDSHLALGTTALQWSLKPQEKRLERKFKKKKKKKIFFFKSIDLKKP